MLFPPFDPHPAEGGSPAAKQRSPKPRSGVHPSVCQGLERQEEPLAVVQPARQRVQELERLLGRVYLLLLYSDGLTTKTSEEEIRSLLAASPDPQAACERLVAAANERGGEDNISVIVVHYGPLRTSSAAGNTDPRGERSPVSSSPPIPTQTSRIKRWPWWLFGLLCVALLIVALLIYIRYYS